jgi:hypothetical protein
MIVLVDSAPTKHAGALIFLSCTILSKPNARAHHGLGDRECRIDASSYAAQLVSSPAGKVTRCRTKTQKAAVFTGWDKTRAVRMTANLIKQR